MRRHSTADTPHSCRRALDSTPHPRQTARALHHLRAAATHKDVLVHDRVDPGVFTELVEKFGASGCEFAELYSLDDAELAQLQPVLGSYFCSSGRAKKTTGPVAMRCPGCSLPSKLSVTRATQAILGCLLNRADAEGLTLGPALEELKTFAADLPFDMRGLAIENAEKIRTAHNARLRAARAFRE